MWCLEVLAPGCRVHDCTAPKRGSRLFLPLAPWSERKHSRFPELRLPSGLLRTPGLSPGCPPSSAQGPSSPRGHSASFGTWERNPHQAAVNGVCQFVAQGRAPLPPGRLPHSAPGQGYFPVSWTLRHADRKIHSGSVQGTGEGDSWSFHMASNKDYDHSNWAPGTLGLL